MLKIVRHAAIALVCAALAAAALVRFAPDSLLGRTLATPVSRPDPATPSGLALPSIAIGGPFALIGANGAVVRNTSFPGKWKLIYFGYTTCPDVCPTTLQVIAGALALLGKRADSIAPLFITIDPERDRPEVIGRYTALFDPRIVGLTGSPAQIAAVESDYRVYAARVNQPRTNGYTMDHTSFIYLMDTNERIRALFDRSISAAALAAAIAKAQQ